MNLKSVMIIYCRNVWRTGVFSLHPRREYWAFSSLIGPLKIQIISLPGDFNLSVCFICCSQRTLRS
jgi:hypothetical protein